MARNSTSARAESDFPPSFLVGFSMPGIRQPVSAQETGATAKQPSFQCRQHVPLQSWHRHAMLDRQRMPKCTSLRLLMASPACLLTHRPLQSRALLIKSHDPHCLCSHQASGICVATTFHRYTHHIFLRSPSATNASHSYLGRHAATTSCNACYSFLEVARGSNIDTSCNVLAPNEHLRPKRRRTRLRNM